MVIKKLKFILVGSPEGTKTKAFVFFAVKITFLPVNTHNPTKAEELVYLCVLQHATNFKSKYWQENFILEEN